MFYCKVEDMEQCSLNMELLHEAEEWLKNVDLAKLEDGKYVISEGVMFAMVNSYETEPIEKRHFEAHKKYVEIQYMISGEELFGICTMNGQVRAGEEKENDNYFYQFPQEYSSVILHPGEFLILLPTDVHASHGQVGKSAHVRKVIIKFHV